MGSLIDLDTHRRRREPAPEGAAVACRLPARFWFDIVSPFTYLASERVERLFPNATWCPVDPGVSAGAAWSPEVRHRAEARALALGMPLMWPDDREVPRDPEPDHGRAARRASAYAASLGASAAFVTRAGRLAFCGGYDLDDPDVLAEAAVSARISPDDLTSAAADPAWDAPLVHAAARIAALGSLPVLECANRVFAGEHRVAEAVAASHARAH